MQLDMSMPNHSCLTFIASMLLQGFSILVYKLFSPLINDEGMAAGRYLGREITRNYFDYHGF